MVMLRGPKERKYERGRRKKTKHNNTKCQNSPIDVIYSIKEDGSAISWIHNNTINRDMPILVQQVMLVDVPPPSCQPMVPFPHLEHFFHKMRKVGVSLDNGIKFCIGLLP